MKFLVAHFVFFFVIFVSCLQTLLPDVAKFKELQKECTRLTTIATVVLVTLSNVGSALRDITEFRKQIKEHICLLLTESMNDK